MSDYLRDFVPGGTFTSPSLRRLDVRFGPPIMGVRFFATQSIDWEIDNRERREIGERKQGAFHGLLCHNPFRVFGVFRGSNLGAQ